MLSGSGTKIASNTHAESRDMQARKLLGIAQVRKLLVRQVGTIFARKIAGKNYASGRIGTKLATRARLNSYIVRKNWDSGRD